MGLRSVGCDGQLETQSTDQFRAEKEPPAAATCLTQAATRANNRVPPDRPDSGGRRSMLPFCNTPPGFFRFGNSRNKQTPGNPTNRPPSNRTGRPAGRGPVFLIHPSVQLAPSAQSLNSRGIFLVFLRRKKRGITTEKANCTEAPLDSCRIMAQRSTAHCGHSDRQRPRVPHADRQEQPRRTTSRWQSHRARANRAHRFPRKKTRHAKRAFSSPPSPLFPLVTPRPSPSPRADTATVRMSGRR